jgi:hypothetical protein
MPGHRVVERNAEKTDALGLAAHAADQHGLSAKLSHLSTIDSE